MYEVQNNPLINIKRCYIGRLYFVISTNKNLIFFSSFPLSSARRTVIKKRDTQQKQIRIKNSLFSFKKLFFCTFFSVSLFKLFMIFVCFFSASKKAHPEIVACMEIKCFWCISLRCEIWFAFFSLVSFVPFLLCSTEFWIFVFEFLCCGNYGRGFMIHSGSYYLRGRLQKTVFCLIIFLEELGSYVGQKIFFIKRTETIIQRYRQEKRREVFNWKSFSIHILLPSVIMSYINAIESR